MATHSIRMAKASKDDINSTTNFLMALEVINDSDFNLEDYKDDEDKKFYSLLKSMTNEKGEPDLDNILFVFNARYSHKWRRVTMGCDILIDNCCDPNLNHLDWKPEIKALLPQEEEE